LNCNLYIKDIASYFSKNKAVNNQTINSTPKPKREASKQSKSFVKLQQDIKKIDSFNEISIFYTKLDDGSFSKLSDNEKNLIWTKLREKKCNLEKV
jgi:hypothetical protein